MNTKKISRSSVALATTLAIIFAGSAGISSAIAAPESPNEIAVSSTEASEASDDSSAVSASDDLATNDSQSADQEVSENETAISAETPGTTEQESSSNDSQTRATATPVAITSPSNGDILTNRYLEFHGTGEPGATIEITGVVRDLATVKVRYDGTWTATSKFAMEDDVYDIFITQTPANGAPVSHASMQISVSASTPGTHTPSLPIEANNQPVTLTFPAYNSNIDTRYVEFRGTGEPGATIEISGVIRDLATVKVRYDGTWTATSKFAMEDDNYRLTIIQTSKTNVVTSTEALFSIATGVGGTPINPSTVIPVALTSPAMNETLSDRHVVFSGTGDPGATIDITGAVRDLTSVKVRYDGTWTATSKFAMEDDTYWIYLTQTAKTGEVSTDKVWFSIKLGSADSLTLTTPAAGSTVAGPYLAFRGTGEPNAKINISNGQGIIAETTVKADGSWVAISSYPLISGSHNISVNQYSTSTQDYKTITESINIL